MNLDRSIFLLAGTLTLIGTALGAAVSPWWLLLTAFVGLNMLQASLTGICPAAFILKRFGITSGCAVK